MECLFLAPDVSNFECWVWLVVSLVCWLVGVVLFWFACVCLFGRAGWLGWFGWLGWLAVVGLAHGGLVGFGCLALVFVL